MMFAAMSLMVLTAICTNPAVSDDAILLEFSSPHCPPCRAMQPVIQQLERSGIPIRHVDVETEPQLAQRYGVRSTPTFVVMRGGQEVTRLIGIQTAAELNAALAINPSGPLVATRSAQQEIEPPQTRLAPIHSSVSAQPPVPSSVPSPVPPPARTELMPSLSVADAIQRAQAATVRLRVYDGNGHGAGTGTIIDTHGEEALVLTCGHLFRETKGQGKIEVDLFVGGEVKTVLGQVLDYDPDTRDIALVTIRPGYPVQPVQVISADQRVSNGAVAFSFGCDRGNDPTRRDTRITGIDKYDQHLGVSNLEIEVAPVEGRSGGGLFDEQGRLIGVCNAADYKNDVGIYAGPGNVHWQLDRVNLTQLYQSPNPAQPDDRIASLAAVTPPAAAQPLSEQPLSPNQLSDEHEVIVIVRQRGNPAASKVMTLQQPTADLLNMIERQARAAGSPLSR
jgi:thiol-disulfide isomerase/thioredoxin